MAGEKRLTDTKIKTLTLKGDGFHADGGNLYLRIRGSGRSWVFRFKIRRNAKWAAPDQRGKPIEIGLGAYPALGIAAARELAAPLREAVEKGEDPRECNKVDDGSHKTFKAYASEYISNHESGWRNPKHRQQWRNTIIGEEGYAVPLWDKRPGDITAGDVHAMLLPLWASKTETATRVRQRVETILDYAFVKEGIDRRNPARWKGNLEHVLPPPRKLTKVKSHAAPPWRECPGIMASLRAKPEVTSALALRFSILTAARSTEVRALVWSEIDVDAAIWTLPAERSKNDNAHIQPLNAEALEILAIMAERKHPDTDRVFPGATGGLLSDVAINKVLHAAMPGITAHGIARSSFRDWAAENGYPDKVAEAALNHTNPNAVEARYLRTKFFEQRIKMMEAWGDFLKGKDNVVGFSPAAKSA